MSSIGFSERLARSLSLADSTDEPLSGACTSSATAAGDQAAHTHNNTAAAEPRLGLREEEEDDRNDQVGAQLATTEARLIAVPPNRGG